MALVYPSDVHFLLFRREGWWVVANAQGLLWQYQQCRSSQPGVGDVIDAYHQFYNIAKALVFGEQGGDVSIL